MNKTLQRRKRLQAKAKTDSVAALELAQSFGFETPKNFRREVNWYRSAAEMANVEAQNLFGECYRDGHGIRRNLNLRITVILCAANREEPNAYITLGHLLCYGK